MKREEMRPVIVYEGYPNCFEARLVSLGRRDGDTCAIIEREDGTMWAVKLSSVRLLDAPIDERLPTQFIDPNSIKKGKDKKSDEFDQDPDGEEVW